MTIMSDLAALQEIDTELDRLAKVATDLRARIADDPQLRQLMALRNSVANSLQQSQLAQRSLEGQSQSEGEEIRRREERLASGRLRSSDDYQRTQSEIEQHTSKRRDLDDELIARMEDVEAATARLAQLDRDLQAAKSARLQRVHADMQELKTVEAAIATQKTHRAASEARVTPGARAIYDRLRQTKAGRAVSVVQGPLCGVCRVAIPSVTLSKARPGNAFVTCENCGRLLYVHL